MMPEENFKDDEKIRKVILIDFKNHCSEHYCEGVDRDMIIAWLEKQGKSLKKDNNERNMVELKLCKWEYFGCSNDRSVWHNVFLNKPSMKLFINSCTIINSSDAIENIDIDNGQNRLPDAFHEDFANAIKNEEFNEIVFGIQKRQDWGYVYLVKSGIYYFFHCFSK